MEGQLPEHVALDEELLEAVADETAEAILRESAHLPEREKRIVLGIMLPSGSQPDIPVDR